MKRLTPKTILALVFSVAFLMLFVRVHRIEDGIHIETRYYSIAVKSDGF